jgi:hypothetical protein
MRAVPTHSAVRSGMGGIGGQSPKSRIVEASEDDEKWVEIDQTEDNGELNGMRVTATFGVLLKRECRFLRFVNMGRHHWGADELRIAAWEVFGSLLE